MQPNDGSRTLVAVLGRRDLPTDGVQDYCGWLGGALKAQGYRLTLHRVAWAERGWVDALRQLHHESAGWRNRWVLVQYTALGWSQRGFPFGLLAVLGILESRGARCAVVFHDPELYGGERLIDRLRRLCQRWVMRTAYACAAHSILTLPPEKVSWLPANPAKAVMIPVGANLPEPPNQTEDGTPAPRGEKGEKDVVVFGITGGAHGNRELKDIAYAMNLVAQQVPALRLMVLGRHSEEARDRLSHALNGTEVQLRVLGLLPAEDVARTISRADALLFVRGGITSGRGSAIAGIACGLPVVGYADVRTAFPITEAGVVLVPFGDREALAEALGRVLLDESFNRELRRRSRAAQREHFSWSAIAARYAEVLKHA